MATKQLPATKPGHKGQAPNPKPNQKASPTQVATRATATVADPKLAALLEEDSGAGRENITLQDISIPRISILQALSPQCVKRGEAYIDGAEPGMLFDNINNRLWDGEEGITVIPISYRKAYIEWIPKDAGGGFVADHGTDSSILEKCTSNDKGQDLLPNGHQIATTAEYFVYIIDEAGGPPTEAVISMSSTQLKKSRRWNTMWTGIKVQRPDGSYFNPAIFYSSYKLTTVPESNDKGNWFGWNIELGQPTMDLPVGQELYLSARNFRDRVQAGNVKVAAPVHDGETIEGDLV